MTPLFDSKTNRRTAIRKLLLPVALTAPALWNTPLISSVILPAHAQTSPGSAAGIDIGLLPEGSTDTRECSGGINQGRTGHYEFGFFGDSDAFYYLDAITFSNPNILLLEPTPSSFPIRFGRLENGDYRDGLSIRTGELADCSTATPGDLTNSGIPVLHFRGRPPTPINEI